MDKQLLQSYIVKHDGKQEVLATAMGLSLSRLNAKINETKGAQFNKNEMAFIRERYKLTSKEADKIFFAQ